MDEETEMVLDYIEDLLVFVLESDNNRQLVNKLAALDIGMHFCGDEGLPHVNPDDLAALEVMNPEEHAEILQMIDVALS